MQQVVREKNFFVFYENEESKLYRKFLTSWNTYWKGENDSPTSTDLEEENIVEGRRVYFAKTHTYKFVPFKDDEEKKKHLDISKDIK